jgi:hypothetical protein
MAERIIAKRKSVASHRVQAMMEQARAVGLVGGAKDRRIAGRVSGSLLAAAKKRAGTSSDSGVIEVALATLALEDDFGAKLVRRKGSIPRDIDLEF